MTNRADDPSFDPKSDDPHSYGTGNCDRMWMRPNCQLADWSEVASYAITIDGYAWMEQHPGLRERCDDLICKFQVGESPQVDFVHLRCCLFLWQRCMRHWSSEGEAYEKESQFGLHLHRLVCDAWDRETKGGRNQR